MLHDKTNVNNSFLEEILSFCLALMIVSTFFFIGLNSFHFNHPGIDFTGIEKINLQTEPVSIDICDTQIEICKDIIVENKLDNTTQFLPLINTRMPQAKSSKWLRRKLKIKDPVITTPPTGLSSSFKALEKPIKKIKLPVTTNKQEPVLGVSKPYTLNKSLSRINPPVIFNNRLVNSPKLNIKHLNRAKKRAISKYKMSELSELLSSTMETAEASNKQIILSFGAKWCAPCKQMDNNVYTNSTVKSIINDHYIFIKLNDQEFEAITLKQLYHVKVYPTTIILDATGTVQARYEEVMTASQMIYNLNDHIPTDQTKGLMASNEIELNKSRLELINSGIDYLLKEYEESNLGLRK